MKFFQGSHCRVVLGFGRARVKEQDMLFLPGMADTGREKWHLLSTEDSHQSTVLRICLVWGEHLPEEGCCH